jgi:hypothetical protein
MSDAAVDMLGAGMLLAILFASLALATWAENQTPDDEDDR